MDLSFKNAKQTDLTIQLDQKPFKVTMYEACYVTHPTCVSMILDGNNPDQRVSIYIPENAAKSSPIIFFVKNHGWIMNAYVNRHKVEEAKDYSSTSQDDLIGKVLHEGYVLVTYGCRSRGDHPDKNGKYISHSPATMTDTKAVIRYLRYNQDLLPAGDTDKIIITGTSGGGALSTIIGASGNSPDFYPSLYEIGAAGIEKQENKYISTINDDIYGVIAYCPINDLRKADAGYEYTYYSTRKRLIEEGLPVVDFKNNLTFQDPFNEEHTIDMMLEASNALKKDYEQYIDFLSLKDENNELITSSTFKNQIRKVINQGIEKAYHEIGIEKMMDDLKGNALYSRRKTTEVFNSTNPDWHDFFSYKEGIPYLKDEKALEDYLYFVARNQTLKVACAFSNKGLAKDGWASMSHFNEDSLYGSPDYPYSAYEFYSWDHNRIKGNGCGKNNTGLSFEEYLADHQELKDQLNMSSPIYYLTDRERKTPCSVAPYWYVRHGLRDRDTSFAVQSVLYYAIQNNPSIKNANVALAWMQPHAGDYDVQEAYKWLKEQL